MCSDKVRKLSAEEKHMIRSTAADVDFIAEEYGMDFFYACLARDTVDQLFDADEAFYTQQRRGGGEEVDKDYSDK